MKSTFRNVALTALFTLFAPIILAQDDIAISDVDIRRMGIVFAPVQAMDNNAGARFPATVINSPDSVTTLSARYAGIIDDWKKTSGSLVDAGQILAVIESPEILSVQNDWMAALAENKRAQFELSKDQSLFDQGVISEQRLVQARNRAQQAAFAEKSAEAQLRLAGFDETRLKSLGESGAGLGSYFLVAPVSALLTQRMGNVGSYIEANAPVAYLNTGERRWVSIHVPGRFATDMVIGQTLTVADSPETLTLRQKDYVIDSSNQTIELFAEFDRVSRVTTGQVISVVLPPARDGILIPSRAVVHRGNIATVYVRTASGVQARDLAVIPVGGQYLAETGLMAGEQVAVQGSAVLKGMQLGLGGSE